MSLLVGSCVEAVSVAQQQLASPNTHACTTFNADVQFMLVQQGVADCSLAGSGQINSRTHVSMLFVLEASSHSGVAEADACLAWLQLIIVVLERK
jgi:hypothetical protein